MPAYFTDPAERIDELLAREDARIAGIFRTLVEQLKGEIDLDELADLLEQGRQEEAFERLQIVAERLGAEVNVSFVTSGQSTTEFLNAAGVGRAVFNQVNTQAVAAMQRKRLELIREFTDEQRRATSLALISGVEAGRNPRGQARDFRDSIGLTERQWAAVANYRRALGRVGTDESGQLDALNRALRDKRGDPSIRRAVREARPLDPERIDWLVRRYTERYVKYRSEVIGRTEALGAVHQGNHESYRQAIANGVIKEEDLERTWETRVDGRQRDSHLILNQQKRGFDEPWMTRHGPILHPGDPEADAAEIIQCRCAVSTRIRRA